MRGQTSGFHCWHLPWQMYHLCFAGEVKRKCQIYLHWSKYIAEITAVPKNRHHTVTIDRSSQTDVHFNSHFRGGLGKVFKLDWWREGLGCAYCKACIFANFTFFFSSNAKYSWRKIVHTIHIYIYYAWYLSIREKSMSWKSLLGKTRTIHVCEKSMLYSSKVDWQTLHCEHYACNRRIDRHLRGIA